MNVMLHKRCAKFIYVIPEGLRELMSDISREVIRSQPENIYTFIADYLDALMITRENARVAARLVDTIIRIAITTVELLEETGMHREEADRMAAIIQNAFKQYMATRRVSSARRLEYEEADEEQEMVSNILEQFGGEIQSEEGAAEIIQKAFRMFREKHKREQELLSGMIDWRVAARSAIYLYRKTGATMEDANRAATLIKAAYKGYYTRRVMKRLLEEGSQLYEDEEEKYPSEVMPEEEEEFYDEEEEQDEDERPSMRAHEWTPMVHAATEAKGTSESEPTSTEIAASVIDSVLDLIPSDTEPIADSGATATSASAITPNVTSASAITPTATTTAISTTPGTEEWTEGLSAVDKPATPEQSVFGEFETHVDLPEDGTFVSEVPPLNLDTIDTEEHEEFVEGSGNAGPESSTIADTEYTETVTDLEATDEGGE